MHESVFFFSLSALSFGLPSWFCVGERAELINNNVSQNVILFPPVRTSWKTDHMNLMLPSFSNTVCELGFESFFLPMQISLMSCISSFVFSLCLCGRAAGTEATIQTKCDPPGIGGILTHGPQIIPWLCLSVAALAAFLPCPCWSFCPPCRSKSWGAFLGARQIQRNVKQKGQIKSVALAVVLSFRQNWKSWTVTWFKRF